MLDDLTEKALNKRIGTIEDLMKLIDYIKKYYNGNKSAFAKACGTTPQRVNDWLVAEYIVDDGKLYSYRRDLPVIELKK